MNSMISVRVNKSQKEKAKIMLKDFGLTLSAAINILINRIAKEGRIPFRISRKKYIKYKNENGGANFKDKDSTVLITIRIDKDKKQKAQVVLKELGLTLSAMINIYINKIVMDDGIPFMLYEPSEELKEAFEDVRLGRNLHGPYSSVEEMFNDIFNNEDDE